MCSAKNYILAAYSGDGNTVDLTEDDLAKITHLNHFSAGLKDGKIDPASVKGTENLARLKKENPGFKTLISVGGWGVDGFSQAVTTEEGTVKLAKSFFEFMKEHNFDGIDLDWEYPGIPGGGIAASPDDKKNFTRLLQVLREMLADYEQQTGQHYLLTIAAGAYQPCADNMELPLISEKYLDFINLMTYDMGSSSKTTGHHTNLFAPSFNPDDYCVEKAVAIYRKAGVPLNKIVIGAAFYGHSWQGVPDENNGLNQQAETNGGTFHDYRDIVENFIKNENYTRYWDEQAKAPYLFDGDRFVSYDDRQSLECKVQYVKEKKLGGIMYFIHHADRNGELLNVLDESLQKK